MDNERYTFILPIHSFPEINDKYLNLFSFSYWGLIEEFLFIFSFAETWDDINGVFETMFLEGEGGFDIPIDKEVEMTDNMVQLMEIYGDWNEKIGRILHFLRTPPDNKTVAGFQCNKISLTDVVVNVFLDKCNPEEGFRPDLDSPASNVTTDAFNPQKLPIFLPITLSII